MDLAGDHEDVPDALTGLLLALERPGQSLRVDEAGGEERLADGRDGEWVMGDEHVARVVGVGPRSSRDRGRMFDTAVD